MGNKFFGVDISGLIKQNIGPGVHGAVLKKVTAGTRAAGQLTGGTQPVETPYPCRGFRDKLDRHRIDGTLVRDTDVAVGLIGDTIAGGSIAPEPGDKVTIHSVEYNIITVEADPADALYVCAARAN